MIKKYDENGFNDLDFFKIFFFFMILKKLKPLFIVKKKLKKLKLICIFYLRVFCDLFYLIFFR